MQIFLAFFRCKRAREALFCYLRYEKKWFPFPLLPKLDKAGVARVGVISPGIGTDGYATAK